MARIDRTLFFTDPAAVCDRFVKADIEFPQWLVADAHLIAANDEVLWDEEDDYWFPTVRKSERG